MPSCASRTTAPEPRGRRTSHIAEEHRPAHLDPDPPGRLLVGADGADAQTSASPRRKAPLHQTVTSTRTRKTIGNGPSFFVTAAVTVALMSRPARHGAGS